MTGPEGIKATAEKGQNSFEKEKLIAHAKELFKELDNLDAEGPNGQYKLKRRGHEEQEQWKKNFLDKYRELEKILEEENITLKEIGLKLSDLYNFSGRNAREGDDYDPFDPVI